jgi:aminopeptidase N
MTEQKGRLPVTVIPHHYDLQYKKIDLERHVFDGVLTMHATVPSPTNRTSLLLHSLELQIVSCTLNESNESKDEQWSGIEYRYNIPQQTVEIVFDDFAGWKEGAAYTIKIHFTGILNDQMRGLYRSTYIGLDGKPHTMATTQFEATDARRAFPCLDEPAHKATFQLTVSIPPHLQGISNTPFESVYTTYLGNNQSVKTIQYQKTPKMSTYLLALVVGDFDAISKTSPAGIQTTVYTIPGKAHQGTFCLETATKCLDLYQTLFNIPYPLTKSDLLAIPDFAAGAMENWGA